MEYPGETTTSILKTTWMDGFNGIENSPNPYSAVRFVSKSAVNGIPPRFYRDQKNSLLPTFKERSTGGYKIREIGPVYIVTKSGPTNSGSSYQLDRGVIEPGLGSSIVEPGFDDGLLDTSIRNTGLVPTGRSNRVQPYQDTNQKLTTGQKLVGGAILILVAYKGIQALLSAASNNLEQTSPQSASPPRLARAATRLEDKQYNIFVSHSWEYDDHYERIVEFLDEVPSLNWQNHSVPSTNPLPVTTDEALRSELRAQMQTAAAVIVSSGMYGAHSKWIPEELQLAKDLGKPVIAITPEGQSKVPTMIQETADTTVGWRKASLVNALAEYA